MAEPVLYDMPPGTPVEERAFRHGIHEAIPGGFGGTFQRLAGDAHRPASLILDRLIATVELLAAPALLSAEIWVCKSGAKTLSIRSQLKSCNRRSSLPCIFPILT